MKRISINIILIIVFILLLTVIILPFAAEMEFRKAGQLEEDYRWKKAGEKYQTALRLDPFNARYVSKAGDFLARQAIVRRKDRTSLLKRAEKLYERACRLNPGYAEYWYKLGKIQLDKTMLTGSFTVDSLQFTVVENFRKAIEKDPYNLRNNYLVGNSLLTVWNSLGEKEKNFALSRLKYILRSRPWRRDSVYSAVLYHTRDISAARRITPPTLNGHNGLYNFIIENNLWQYRKSQKRLVDFYKQKNEKFQ